MTLDRTKLTHGTDNTVANLAWENEFKNKINHILDNVVDTDAMKDYIRGMTLSWVNASTILVSSGTCVSDDGTDVLVIPKNTSIDIIKNILGENGADEIIVNNVMYYVWVMKHSVSGKVSAILSQSDTDPKLPPYFYSKRLIGAVKIESTGDIRQFFQKGNANQREFFYATYTTISSNATPSSGTWVNANASSVVPLSEKSRLGYFELCILGTFSGDTQPTVNGNMLGELRSGENAGGGPLISVLIRIDSGATLSGDTSGTGWVKTSSTGIVQYRRNGFDSGEGTPRVFVRCYGFRINV